MKQKYTLGVIGCGVVGGLLCDHFKEQGHNVKKRDPKLRRNDPVDKCDAVFICIPVYADSTGSQDVDALTNIVNDIKLKSDAPIFIRSTVLPGINDRLGTFSFPEFITERTRKEDFKKQPLWVGGHRDLIKNLFPHHVVQEVRNVEAEMGKMVHNCFGAMKVSYFNYVQQLTEAMNGRYFAVRDIVTSTGYISETHTQVPGPDGKMGWGGKCFPQNMLAFKGMIPLLETAWKMNKAFRKFTSDELPFGEDE